MFTEKQFDETSWCGRLMLVLTVMLCVCGMVKEVAAQTPAAEKTIESYIRREAKAQTADEYKEARKVVFDDVNGDGNNDAVVQYTLEGFGGGNNFAQMLVVFINQKGVYKFASEEVVGSKMSDRTSELKSVANGKILLATESCPEPPQGICENPKKGKATFVFRKGKLKEL